MGDRCLLVTLGDHIDARVNRSVLALAADLLADPPEGVIDAVPAFTTVALHHLPQAYARPRRRALCLPGGPCAGTAAARHTGYRCRVQGGGNSRLHGGSYSPDLDEVAERCGLTTGK